MQQSARPLVPRFFVASRERESGWRIVVMIVAPFQHFLGLRDPAADSY